MLLRGVARRDRAVRLNRTQLRERIRCGVGADALVPRYDDRVAAWLRNPYWDDLGGHTPILPGRRGTEMAAHSVGVRLLARNFVLPRKVLRRLDHTGDAAEPMLRLRALATAI